MPSLDSTLCLSIESPVAHPDTTLRSAQALLPEGTRRVTRLLILFDQNGYRDE
jgi:hypothetical protein